MMVLRRSSWAHERFSAFCAVLRCILGSKEPQGITRVHIPLYIIPDENIILIAYRNPLRRPSEYGRTLMVYLFFLLFLTTIGLLRSLDIAPRARQFPITRALLLLKNTFELKKFLSTCSDAE